MVLRHSLWQTPLDEWLSKVAGALPQDGVFLLQPVIDGSEGFGLTGEALDSFVHRAIVNLLRAGAVPAEAGSCTAIIDYSGTITETADQIVADWRSGKVRADHDGLWFVLPPT